MLGTAVKAGPLLAMSGLVVGLLGLASPTVADPAPVRIMVVGENSITEGSIVGDWTWRYRLAKYLDASDVSYDLVGPRTTMLDLADNLHDSDEYVDPDFDQHHFARWGESLHAILDENAATPEDSIGWAVATYQPDVVIEVLGTNDLLYGSSPQETVDTAHQLVAEVRAARPDATVVLSTVPDVQYDHFSAFNDLLEAQAPSWATPTSPVVVSDPSPGWSAATDTCDNTHPSAAGEVKIAAAEADALAALGIGSPAPRPLPEPPPGPRRPAVLSAVPGDGHVSLFWDLPPGGTAVLIPTRDVTAGQDWHQLPYAVGGTAWLSDGLTNGDTYEYRLNVLKHDCIAQDVDSDIVAVATGAGHTGPDIGPHGRSARPRVRRHVAGRRRRHLLRRVGAEVRLRCGLADVPHVLDQLPERSTPGRCAVRRGRGAHRPCGRRRAKSAGLRDTHRGSAESCGGRITSSSGPMAPASCRGRWSGTRPSS